MTRLSFVSLVLCAACSGPGGRITGTLTVKNGSPGSRAISTLGPTVTGTATADDGTFTLEALTDGTYAVSAHVPGARVPDLTVSVVVNGSEAGPVSFSFELPAGAVTGKVVLEDGSSAAGLLVLATGPMTATTLTGAQGEYAFSGLPPGTYLLSTELDDSLQQRVTTVVTTLDAAVTASDLRLTPVSALSGTVKLPGGAAAEGARVEMAGLGLVTVTDALGAFAFAAVPTGARNVVARLAPALISSAMVTVTRGAPATATLTLALDSAQLGTVTGTLNVGSTQGPAGLTVSAQGTAFTTTLAGDGVWSLKLPDGEWTLVAQGPHYPDNALGTVRVKAGQTVALGAQPMSMFTLLPAEAAVGEVRVVSPRAGDRVLLLARDAAGATEAWSLLDLKTLARRNLMRVPGNTGASATLSPRGTFIAYRASDSLGPTFIVRTDTWQTVSIPDVVRGEFTDDESFYFASSSTRLVRFELATGASADFPPIYSRLAPGRYVLGAGPSTALSLSLLTTTGGPVPLATAVEGWDSRDALTTFSDCAAGNCTLKVLPLATGQRMSVVAGTFPGPTAPFHGNTANPNWLHLFSDLSQQRLIDAATGASGPLPAGTFSARVSPAGSRVIISTGLSGPYEVRDEATPPLGTSMPVYTSTSFTGTPTWVSPTRAVGFDNSATVRRVTLVDGVASFDSDVAPGSGSVTGAFATWNRPSTRQQVAAFGDDAELSFAVPSGGVSVGLVSKGFPEQFAVLAAAAAPELFIADRAKHEVRRLTGYQLVANSAQVGRYAVKRAGSADWEVAAFADDRVLGLTEPGLGEGAALILAAHGGTVAVTFKTSGATSQVAIALLP